MAVLILTSVGTSLLEKDFLPRNEYDAIKNNITKREALDALLSQKESLSYEEKLWNPVGKLGKLNELIEKEVTLGTKYCSEQHKKNILSVLNARTASERKFSSEIASLFRIFEEKLTLLKLPLSASEAKIVLLASDSYDGCFCARVNKSFIEKYICESVEIVRIDGLQVKDAARFKEPGLKKLNEEIQRIYEENKVFDEKIMNITGGFKAAIPYLTIIAWDKPMNLNYVFEDSDALIEITKPENLGLRFRFNDLIQNTHVRPIRPFQN